MGVARDTWPPKFWGLNATWWNVTKYTDFKFDLHVPRTVWTWPLEIFRKKWSGLGHMRGWQHAVVLLLFLYCSYTEELCRCLMQVWWLWFRFTIPNFAVPITNSLSNPNANRNPESHLSESVFFGIAKCYRWLSWCGPGLFLKYLSTGYTGSIQWFLVNEQLQHSI